MLKFNKNDKNTQVLAGTGAPSAFVIPPLLTKVKNRRLSGIQ